MPFVCVCVCKVLTEREDAEEEWEEVSVVCPDMSVSVGGWVRTGGGGSSSSLAAQTQWTPAGRWLKIESPPNSVCVIRKVEWGQRGQVNILHTHTVEGLYCK